MHKDKDDILNSGSRGAGIVIEEGVMTEVEVKKGRGIDVYFNGNQIDLRPSIVMATKIMPQIDGLIVIRHTTKLLIGAGFGVSAACALGTGMCLNEVFSLGMSLESIGEAAHATEIDCGTGLGDVGPMLKGGVEIRRKEGAFGHGLIECVKADVEDMMCFSFGPIDTKKVIAGNRISSINKLSDGILSKLFSDPDFENFMRCSLEFSRKAGFMTERLRDVIDRLNSIDGCLASQTMLGESGFAFFKDDMNKKVLDELKGIDCVGCVFQTKVYHGRPRMIL